jgi:hypothetical protein
VLVKASAGIGFSSHLDPSDLSQRLPKPLHLRQSLPMLIIILLYILFMEEFMNSGAAMSINSKR